jgi:hypothetical protein
MAITSYAQVRNGTETTITVVSDLVGTVYYHWYVDGALLASTTAPTWSILLEPGEQVRIEVLDTLDPDFDALAAAPIGYPSRRSLYWLRSIDADVVKYRVEQQQDAGAWSTIGTVPATVDAWTYSFLTPQLADMAEYTWRIIPVDAAGNDGTPVVIGPESFVRLPDAPDFAADFDPLTERVTFAEAP